MNFYNEFDPHAAAWLRELIARKLIPDGVVDERSITEIHASDLEGFTQAHFFRGIAGWPLALQLAGWPEDRPVWTGSCPCQPFANIGLQLGQADERHLWPVFHELIRQCRPKHVFGEQVADAIGKGWLDGVSDDLEGIGYACGATVLAASSVGAPHIRQRLYWVGHALDAGLEGHAGNGNHLGQQGRDDPQPGRSTPPPSEPWDRYAGLPCTDGKTRRVQPGTFPMAHGVPGRMGRISAYGNAIVPALAAEFIQAYLETVTT